MMIVAMVGSVNASLYAVQVALTEGPSSIVADAVLAEFDIDASEPISVAVEHAELSFMDTSHIADARVRAFTSGCAGDGTVLPFDLDLPYVEAGGHGFNGMRLSIDGDQNRVTVSPAVAAVGDTILLNGQTRLVTATGTTGLDFINRTTVIEATNLPLPFYWGIIVTDPAPEMADCAQLHGLHLVELELLTSNNRRFWERNGTPIVLVLTLVLMGVTMVLVAQDRGSIVRKHALALTALRQIGRREDSLVGLAFGLSALLDVFRATLVLVPLTVTINAMFNAATFGLATASSVSIAVAYSLAMFPSVVGSAWAYRRMSRIPVSQIVRGQIA
ncbi:MAG: hypothetical protein GY946_29470 [bacterium]|nr:hypothetical protein [bacterium]